MGLGDYGLAVGEGLEGYRTQQDDAMKKEAFDMKKEGFDMDKEKFITEMEKSKKALAKEGYREAIQMIISGDLRGAEEHFNTVGEDRVKPGSTKYDRKTGLVSWIDKQGQPQAADIRMMAAMGGINLPKLPEKDSMKERNYGLKIDKFNLSKQKRFDKIKKETRGEIAQLYKGELGDNGIWVVPEGNREPYARAIRVADKIHRKYPDKYDPGELARIVTVENDSISGERIVTEEEARDQAVQEAKAKGGVKGIFDSSDFGGISRKEWVENRTKEIVDKAKGVERNLMRRVLSKINKQPRKLSKSDISAARKDPKKYADILLNTPGWSKEQINEAISKRFPGSVYRVK